MSCDIVSQDEEFSENSVEALKLAIKTVKETARCRSIAPEQDTIKLKSSEPIHPNFHANTVEPSVVPAKSVTVTVPDAAGKLGNFLFYFYFIFYRTAITAFNL